jgi:hypothetical protein
MIFASRRTVPADALEFEAAGERQSGLGLLWSWLSFVYWLDSSRLGG